MSAWGASAWEARAQRQSVRTLAQPGGDRARMVAWLVSRPDDCRSHTELLRLFERPSIASDVSLGGVLLVGKGLPVDSAVALLGREFPGMVATRASHQERRLLGVLNWVHTPILLVFDSHTRTLRLSVPAPMTDAEQLRLVRLLENIAPSSPLI
jgi:hypothetical protein